MPYLGLHRIASTRDKNLDFSERFSTFFSREWIRSLMRLNLKKWPAADICDSFLSAYNSTNSLSHFLPHQEFARTKDRRVSPSKIGLRKKQICFCFGDDDADIKIIGHYCFFGRPMSASNKRKDGRKNRPIVLERRGWRPHFLISCLSFPLISPSSL